MTFRNLFIDHDRDPEVDAWIEEETKEQEERFAKINQQMEDLAPEREKWYQQFHDRCMTIGYNADADDKVKIAPEDIPIKGDRKDQVIWKYGADSDPTPRNTGPKPREES